MAASLLTWITQYPCRMQSTGRRVTPVQNHVWLLVFVVALILSQGTAQAVDISASAGSTPSTTTPYELAGTGWIVDDGSFPSTFPGLQTVGYASGAGPWRVRLTGAGGLDFAASDIGSGALMVFSVTEYVKIGGTTSWTGWHEEIEESGWRWQDDRPSSGEPTFTFASGAPIPGLSIAFAGATPTEGGKIDFSFAPLPPGTGLKITKRLLFEGLDPLFPGETYVGKVSLRQFPIVPEPSSLLLALTGLLAIGGGLAIRRKRGWRF